MPLPETLTDPADPRFDDYRDLRAAGAGSTGRHRRDLVVVEGRLSVERLLTSRYPVRSVLTTPQRSGTVADLPPGARSLVATRELLAEVCGFDVHRGVLAAATRTPPPTLREVGHGVRLLAVERVGDAENLGALFRTAAALGVGGVVLDDRCADPLSRRAVRVSLGWSLHVPWCTGPSVSRSLQELALAGYRTVALVPGPDAVAVDAAASRGLLDGRVVLAVGAEGDGLDPATITAADVQVAVPMAGEVDSLNVATAFGVVAAYAASRTGWV
ncbi:MAG: TrmH family RNA methyltransferase [Actinomycetes bacterium]